MKVLILFQKYYRLIQLTASNLLPNLVELMSALRNNSDEYEYAKETAVSLPNNGVVRPPLEKVNESQKQRCRLMSYARIADSLIKKCDSK